MARPSSVCELTSLGAHFKFGDSFGGDIETPGKIYVMNPNFLKPAPPGSQISVRTFKCIRLH